MPHQEWYYMKDIPQKMNPSQKPYFQSVSFEYLHEASLFSSHCLRLSAASWWLKELETTVSSPPDIQHKIPSFIQRSEEDTRSPHVILEKQTGVISAAHPHMLGSLEFQHICFWGQSGGSKRDASFYVQIFPDFSYYRGWCTVSPSLFQCASRAFQIMLLKEQRLRQ